MKYFLGRYLRVFWINVSMFSKSLINQQALKLESHFLCLNVIKLTQLNLSSLSHKNVDFRDTIAQFRHKINFLLNSLRSWTMELLISSSKSFTSVAKPVNIKEFSNSWKFSYCCTPYIIIQFLSSTRNIIFMMSIIYLINNKLHVKWQSTSNGAFVSPNISLQSHKNFDFLPQNFSKIARYLLSAFGWLHKRFSSKQLFTSEIHVERFWLKHFPFCNSFKPFIDKTSRCWEGYKKFSKQCITRNTIVQH